MRVSRSQAEAWGLTAAPPKAGNERQGKTRKGGRRKRAGGETALVRTLLEFLALRRLFAWRNNSGGAMLKGDHFVRFGKKGSGDIFVLADRFISIEAKMPGNKPTAAQCEWMDAVRKAGHLAFVIRSVEDLEVALKKEGVIE